MSIFDGDNNNRNQFAGGIKFTSPAFSMNNTGAINGGYSFDLPLATVAAFNERALTFSATNTQNAQGFLQGVLANSQSHVTRVANKTFESGASALSAIERINQSQQETIKYAAKKQAQSGGCFITTAICLNDAKADDCDELQTLRKFRDEVLATNIFGQELIAEYYTIAPLIVEAIDKMENANSVYVFLRDVYLIPAVASAKSGDNVGTFVIYRELFNVARSISGV